MFYLLLATGLANGFRDGVFSIWTSVTSIAQGLW